MTEQPKILVVDDNPQNVEIMKARLAAENYRIDTAFNGEEALEKVKNDPPDLILLDVMMPKMDGFQVCEKLKSDEKTKLIPVIIVSARSGSEDVLKGLQLGADEYLPKPFEHLELIARVKNLLKLRLAQKELYELNHNLEKKVNEQVVMLEAGRRLDRYFSPQIAKTIREKEAAGTKLSTSRKMLTIFVSDIDNFSGISEVSEPEDVVNLLSTYFSAMTQIAFKYGGTLDKFLGDGILIFFNDPTDQPDHAKRAVEMALEMRKKIEELRDSWKDAGHDLCVTMGINSGYVTVGNIGTEDRLDYTVIGNQVNVAFRLCTEAKPGEILVSQRTESFISSIFELKKVGEITVKGIRTPITTFTVSSSNNEKGK